MGVIKRDARLVVQRQGESVRCARMSGTKKRNFFERGS